jgi:membrane fusion protein (multidrug efflux system)
MADQVIVEKPPLTQQPRFRIIVGVVLLIIIGVALWFWFSSGTESTDDAQVDAHVTPISARVGGTVTRVAVDDNQMVEAGTLLVELDPRDYQVAVDKARAELADAEAGALAARSNVPITSTAATSGVTTSFTSASTTAVNAVPMTTATARSMTLPRMTNSLNPFSISAA